jgi:hypothetical protein
MKRRLSPVPAPIQSNSIQFNRKSSIKSSVFRHVTDSHPSRLNDEDFAGVGHWEEV